MGRIGRNRQIPCIRQRGWKSGIDLRSVSALQRAPSAETPRFGVLSIFYGKYGRKPIEQQSALLHRGSPQRSGKGGYRITGHFLASAAAITNTAPGSPKEVDQPLPAPNGVFRGKVPELTFAYFCSGTKVGRPGGETPYKSFPFLTKKQFFIQ